MRGGRAEAASSLLFQDWWILNLERLGSRLVDFAPLAGVAPFSSSFLANAAPSSTSLPARPLRPRYSDLPLGAPRRSAPALGAGKLAFPPHQIWRLLGHRRWRVRLLLCSISALRWELPVLPDGGVWFPAIDCHAPEGRRLAAKMLEVSSSTLVQLLSFRLCFFSNSGGSRWKQRRCDV